MSDEFYAGMTGDFTLVAADGVRVPTAYLSAYNAARSGGSTPAQALAGLPALPGASVVGSPPSWLSEVRAALRAEGTGTAALSAGTLNLDCTNGTNFSVTLTGNVTTVNITNAPTTGWVGLAVTFTQDATGGRTVTGWPAGTKWSPGGVAPTLTATANARDVITGYRIDSGPWSLARAQVDAK